LVLYFISGRTLTTPSVIPVTLNPDPNHPPSHPPPPLPLSGFQNHRNEGKGRGERGKEKRKNNGCTLRFYNGKFLAEKNC